MNRKAVLEPAEVRGEEVDVGLLSVGREKFPSWAVQHPAAARVDVVPGENKTVRAKFPYKHFLSIDHSRVAQSLQS